MMISIWHLAWIIPLVIVLAFGFFALCVAGSKRDGDR